MSHARRPPHERHGTYKAQDARASAALLDLASEHREGFPMLYEVRYQLNGEEQTMQVEAETAATAVEEVHHRLQVGEDGFELIQVSLVGEESMEEDVLTGK